ncbi:DNA repair protein RecO [bacterium]|nr:MAG: DNA repair protein RecO [bacterium]
MIVKDLGIVLRSIDYQDSSKIVGVLTREHGKITVIAKGAKSPKSKYAGLLQAGNILEMVYYEKPNRDIQVLSDASFETKAYPIHYDMEKLHLLMSTLEMVDQLVNDNEHSSDFFEFLSQMIQWVVQEKESVKHLFPYVLIRLADLSGIALHFEDELFESKNDYFINGDDGLISVESHSGLAIKLLPQQAFYTFLACNRKGKRILETTFDDYEIKNLIHHLDVYFKQHIDGLRDRRSDEIFNGL